MPVWKGFTAISFPLIYVLYILFGTPYTALCYALAVMLVNMLQRRPLRIIFFNPAQLALSIFASTAILSVFNPVLDSSLQPDVIVGIVEFFILLISFFICNNLIVDLVLIIRPQPYSLKMWKQKTITELNNALISLVYGILLYTLGSQNRGEIDVFSYFFFFSPLVGLSLLSSTIARLKLEKKRLKALFSITTDLNQIVPESQWLSTLKKSFNEFMNVEASLLWTKEDGIWKQRFQEGRIALSYSLPEEVYEKFECMKHPIIYNDRKKESGIAEDCFDAELKSFVYSPLVVENETVGMFIVARSRTKSFVHEDVQSLATLSNQLAAVIKTQMLFSEKEKRVILEERNRIAREIHDGIAQTLAGAVMKLETAGKIYTKKPDETIKLVEESVFRLRESLKEVRESIYALRPYPTQKEGLVAAISKKIEELRKEYQQHILFEKRGTEFDLSPMAEKILFDSFQESIQNAIKHAEASKIEVLLCNQADHIMLQVKDNGRGFSLFQAMIKAQKQPHFGILQMNDAAEKLNASLQIDSKEGEGTIVVIMVPKMGFEGGSIHDQAHVSG
ncbi:signal transduction histidine kinase [Peribacillus deserti]|uniref:histidine kinase n=1 Tax=Peribacillus deserti TaxID=673318 RepID=A0ABS2QLJ5_9BACI|nr:GAF domain-containing sensor histidine kinase [Peribacillus deserti]MBM7693835.1 signal transduction histidine kinase [Peribacillus deserti]